MCHSVSLAGKIVIKHFAEALEPEWTAGDADETGLTGLVMYPVDGEGERWGPEEFLQTEQVMSLL